MKKERSLKDISHHEGKSQPSLKQIEKPGAFSKFMEDDDDKHKQKERSRAIKKQKKIKNELFVRNDKED